MTGDTLIRCREVSVCYPQGPPVLFVANLEFREGERLGVVGRSGAGKTSFLKVVLNEEVTWSGEIRVSDQLKHAGRIGYVSQGTKLIPWWTCQQHVQWTGRAAGFCDPESTAILDRVGLASAGAKFPDQLSGGMARRLMLAMVLAGNPKVLMLDEAFSATDPFTKATLIQLVDEYCAGSGAALIMVSHDFQEIVSLVGTVSYIDVHGNLLDSGFRSEAVGRHYGGDEVSREAARLYCTVKAILES